MEEITPPEYFHGTNVEFKPGDIITPPNQRTGSFSPWDTRDEAYATNDPYIAHYFGKESAMVAHDVATGGSYDFRGTKDELAASGASGTVPRVYKVEPIDPSENLNPSRIDVSGVLSGVQQLKNWRSGKTAAENLEDQKALEPLKKDYWDKGLPDDHPYNAAREDLSMKRYMETADAEKQYASTKGWRVVGEHEFPGKPHPFPSEWAKAILQDERAHNDEVLSRLRDMGHDIPESASLETTQMADKQNVPKSDLALADTVAKLDPQSRSYLRLPRGREYYKEDGYAIPTELPAYSRAEDFSTTLAGKTSELLNSYRIPKLHSSIQKQIDRLS